MAVLTSRREGDTLIVKHHYPMADRFAALVRIAIGWTFLWTFLDRTFGLGFTTPPSAAWVNGGSPSASFVEFEAGKVVADLLESLAGSAWVDWLFMVGSAVIGLALILGIGMRIAAVTGMVVLLTIYAAIFQPETNPITDERLVYALMLGALVMSDAGDVWGLGSHWKRTRLVHRLPFLK